MECSHGLERGGYQESLRNAFTKQYREGSDEWTNDEEMRIVPAIVQGALKLGPQASALDIGCGAGIDTEYFARLYGNVVGIDLFEHQAWAGVSERCANARFAVGDLFSADVAGSYDVILDNGCFHHQHPERYAEYLGLVRGLLSRQGTLALSTFKNDGLRSRVDANGRLHRYFTDLELRAELEGAGLQEVHSMDIYRRRKGDYYRLSLVRVAS